MRCGLDSSPHISPFWGLALKLELRKGQCYSCFCHSVALRNLCNDFASQFLPLWNKHWPPQRPQGGRVQPSGELAGSAFPGSSFPSLYIGTTVVVTKWRGDHTMCPQVQDPPEHCHHTQMDSIPLSKVWGKPSWPVILPIYVFIQRLSFPYIFCNIHLLSIFLLWWMLCFSSCLGRMYLPKNELYSLLCQWILGWPFLLVGMRHSGVWSCGVSY